MNANSSQSPLGGNAVTMAGNHTPVAGLERFTAPNDSGPEGKFTIDVKSIFFLIRRNLVLIGLITTLALVTGLIVTLLMTPKYVATASVQIDQEADRILNSEDVQRTVAYQDADRFLQTQIDVLESRAMAIRVARSLNLYGSPKLFEIMEERVPSARSGVDRTLQMRDESLQLLAKNLTVTLPRQSRVVSISFRSPDRAFAALVANRFATEFIANNLQRKYESSSYARNFLSKQLAGAKARLEASERALNGYAREARLIRTTEPSATNNETQPRSVTTATLVQINQAANNARATRIAAEQKWNTTAGSPLMNIPDVLGNLAIQNLLEKQAEAKAKFSEERARHRDDFPTVIALRAQVDELQTEINNIARSIKNSIRDQYEVALKQEQSLDAQVAGLKTDTLSEQDRNVRYNILQREADTNRTLYDGLLQRYKEVGAAAGIATNNLSLVDFAVWPVKPASPKLLLNLLAALFVGFCLSGIVMFIREQLDDAVRVPEDLERKLGVHLLAAVPLAEEGGDPISLLQAPRSTVAEAYSVLRSALMLSTSDGLPKRILVTSTQASEGKTTTTYAVAYGLARMGLNIVAVDVDLRRPALHKVLKHGNKTGLTNVLTGQLALDDVIMNTDQENLKLISTGPIPPNPTELLGGERLREILNDLKGRFDAVIMDGPPVLGLADAPILTSYVEGTVFVVQARRTRLAAARGAVKRLQNANGRVLGGVMTKFDVRHAEGSQYGNYEYYRYGSENTE